MFGTSMMVALWGSSGESCTCRSYSGISLRYACVFVRLAPQGKNDLANTCFSYLVPDPASTDYHRFHSPVDGIVGKPTRIEGQYYTVNPQAIRTTLDVYGENVREIWPIQTAEYGTVMTVWVGAMSKSWGLNSYIIEANAPDRS
jgi:hypothetical protein